MQYPVCWEAWDRHNSEYRQLCGTTRLLLAGGDSCLQTYHVLAPPPRVCVCMHVHTCAHAHVHAHVWRPVPNVRCSSSIAFYLAFLRNALSPDLEPRTY